MQVLPHERQEYWFSIRNTKRNVVQMWLRHIWNRHFRFSTHSKSGRHSDIRKLPGEWIKQRNKTVATRLFVILQSSEITLPIYYIFEYHSSTTQLVIFPKSSIFDPSFRNVKRRKEREKERERKGRNSAHSSSIDHIYIYVSKGSEHVNHIHIWFE